MRKIISLNSKIAHLIRCDGATDWTKVLDDWLRTKPSAKTQAAYRKDIENFLNDSGITLGAFLTLTKSEAFEKVSIYKGMMIASSLTPATINRRLSTIKSLVSYSYNGGHCEYNLDKMILSVPSKPYRDTTGITLDQFKQVLSQCDLNSLIGVRDFAILHLLWSNALRRGEVNSLNRSDFDPINKQLKIMGKGRREPEWISLSNTTVVAVTGYLSLRNDKEAPLFISHDKVYNGHRLSTESISQIVQKYCYLAGITKKMSPHRIRHSSITTALDVTDGNVRAVQKLSRHSSLNTLLIYDDNRRDEQKKISDLLSSLL